MCTHHEQYAYMKVTNFKYLGHCRQTLNTVLFSNSCPAEQNDMAHQFLFFSQFSCTISIITMNSEAAWKTVWMENSVDGKQCGFISDGF